MDMGKKPRRVEFWRAQAAVKVPLGPGEIGGIDWFPRKSRPLIMSYEIWPQVWSGNEIIKRRGGASFMFEGG